MKIIFRTSPLVFLIAASLTGCATITKDANQSVQIETYSKDNQPVSGAKCVAQNDRGQWNTSAPGTISVHRSGENLIVNCEKDGEQPGKGTVISRANGGMFGNIVFGGGIGAIIDHNKGTAYTYPSWIRIIMGETLIFDRKVEVENQPMAGVPASATPLKSTETASTQAQPQP
ncbi:uncharacterized protein NMK_1657 [Novimethylophilus kurashikiensis]|uniref:Lipoprotein n=1 Tax=Novimethylophilus kurashikiensis TaxID=1825523 RepID=A0A2R5F7D2_9PROT|nr:hypothetical protein [Novimethylophilus kurashikiensis]GBG14097.1 uncharacterized protein NMK_1657 [Novimethylophilus kurashikiensis]